VETYQKLLLSQQAYNRILTIEGNLAQIVFIIKMTYS